jgi:hypothetical protein
LKRLPGLKEGNDMGEIKSTLDLVMEKTKNLTFSDEERRNNKEVDINKKIKGLIVKYQDNTLRFSEFEKQVKTIEKQYGIDCIESVAEAVLQRVEFLADNGPLFVILKDFCGMDTAPVQNTINAFREKALTEVDQKRHAVLGLLQKEHHISGSAVVPNLENDEQLKNTLKTLQIEFKEKLTSSERRSRVS